MFCLEVVMVELKYFCWIYFPDQVLYTVERLFDIWQVLSQINSFLYLLKLKQCQNPKKMDYAYQFGSDDYVTIEGH